MTGKLPWEMPNRGEGIPPGLGAFIRAELPYFYVLVSLDLRTTYSCDSPRGTTVIGVQPLSVDETGQFCFESKDRSSLKIPPFG